MATDFFEFPNGWETDGKKVQVVPGLPMISNVVTASGYTFVGQALPGTITSEAKWQMQRVETLTSGLPSPMTGATMVKYAGEGKFNQVFDDYLTLVYA